MTPNGVHMAIALKPAAIGIGAVLVLALLCAVVLSIVIKRREAKRTKVTTPPLPAARVQAQRIQRATSNSLPDDIQERLRYLTGGDKALDLDEEEDAAPVAPTVAARTVPADDSTHFFGDAGADAPLVESFDSTHFFGDGAAPEADDDRTHIFGGADGGDSTHLFGDEAAGDATAFFGAEPRSPRASEQAHEDSTRFFGAEEEEAPTGTDFFTAGDLADPDLDDFPQDRTGQLQALPPAAFGTAAAPHVIAPEAGHPATGHPDASRQFAVVEESETIGFDALGSAEPFAGTGALQALPPSHAPSSIATGPLDRVRERLAAFAEPRVIALSVLDGAGRVLAGEADDDLTGELRSLMAESGQGNAADIDQAVQLGDNTAGALLLLPTGANALLGALVRDDDAGDTTRAHLRGLAHEIGDAMQRAS